MKIERLFKVLVVTGASSSAGLIGCGGDDSPAPSGTGGAQATGGSSSGNGGASAGTGGAAGAAGAAGSAAACDCHPNAVTSMWTDCGGCCCWLAVGQTTMIGTPICGPEPCCAGKGPGR